MTWNRYLSIYINEINLHGITDHILLTFSPFRHWQQNGNPKALADLTITLFQNESLTADQRLSILNNSTL